MKKVFNSYVISIAIGSLMILMTYFFKKPSFSNLMVLIGNGLLFSGTLGFLVRSKLQTWGGASIPEKTSEYILILFYFIGFALTLIFS